MNGGARPVEAGPQGREKKEDLELLEQHRDPGPSEVEIVVEEDGKAEEGRSPLIVAESRREGAVRLQTWTWWLSLGLGAERASGAGLAFVVLFMFALAEAMRTLLDFWIIWFVDPAARPASLESRRTPFWEWSLLAGLAGYPRKRTPHLRRCLSRIRARTQHTTASQSPWLV